MLSKKKSVQSLKMIKMLKRLTSQRPANIAVITQRNYALKTIMEKAEKKETTVKKVLQQSHSDTMGRTNNIKKKKQKKLKVRQEMCMSCGNPVFIRQKLE
jgi:hypothetical protein